MLSTPAMVWRPEAIERPPLNDDGSGHNHDAEGIGAPRCGALRCPARDWLCTAVLLAAFLEALGIGSVNVFKPSFSQPCACSSARRLTTSTHHEALAQEGNSVPLPASASDWLGVNSLPDGFPIASLAPRGIAVPSWALLI